MTRILGISAYFHDSAACLVEDGRIVAAMQEERFSREKHDSSFPQRAIDACFRLGGCSARDLDWVVFYEKPFVKFERLLETYLDHCPRGIRSYLRAMPLWIKEKLWIKDEIRKKLGLEGSVLFADHHESHAASAFYPSPFESAALLTVDGVGEWTTTTLGWGRGSEIRLERELRFPDSLGLLYSALTHFLGFKVNSDEYKLMGLAPFGRPLYRDRIRNRLVEIAEDGSFVLNQEYFDYQVGLTMSSQEMARLFEMPPRRPGDPISQLHKDLAASIQTVTEDILLGICRDLHRTTSESNLCMAGGVALNCVANGRILRESGFSRLWIQPAAGDAGGALGAALAVWHRYLKQDRQPLPDLQDGQNGSQLGTAYSRQEIEHFLQTRNAVFHRCDQRTLLEATAAALCDKAVVGWFQGRMEFGPRALGNRSILADPRPPDMQRHVNLRIKFRESFRPFAPVILEERAADYFELEGTSPYMLLVASVREARRQQIPAVTHIDGSARVQTVNRQLNPRFHGLLETFERVSGCPVLLNTSFNVRGEPIVESPRDAYECFMRTGLDLLVMGDFLLWKKEQPTGLL